MTGILENSQSIHVADGSVVLQTDVEKYRDAEDSLSEVDSNDEIEETERYICKRTKSNNSNYPTQVLYPTGVTYDYRLSMTSTTNR